MFLTLLFLTSSCMMIPMLITFMANDEHADSANDNNNSNGAYIMQT